MELSKISVATEDYLKVKEICSKRRVSFTKIFAIFTDFLSNNESVFLPIIVMEKNLMKKSLPNKI